VTQRDPKKFDPTRAHMLDAPERERYLPTSVLVALLELRGDERVVDYGAGTGRLTEPIAEALASGGHVLAVDESDEMVTTLRERLAEIANASVAAIRDNQVPVEDGSIDRVVALNLLHEVRGETALEEMRRMLTREGFVLVVDWEPGHERDVGPPDRLLYTAEDAAAELELAGLAVERAGAGLPFHFVLLGRLPPPR
jgi:ubiquinone/menaquinone biosynthesis C-methylase UbiE